MTVQPVTISNLRAGYGGDDIVNDVSFDVRPGEVTELEVRVPMEGEGFAAEFTSTSAAFMGALLAGALVFIEIFADDENSDDDPFKPGF